MKKIIITLLATGLIFSRSVSGAYAAGTTVAKTGSEASQKPSLMADVLTSVVALGLLFTPMLLGPRKKKKLESQLAPEVTSELAS